MTAAGTTGSDAEDVAEVVVEDNALLLPGAVALLTILLNSDFNDGAFSPSPLPAASSCCAVELFTFLLFVLLFVMILLWFCGTDVAAA